MGIILHELIGVATDRPFSPHCWKTVMSLAHESLPFDRNTVLFNEIPRLENGYSSKIPASCIFCIVMMRGEPVEPRKAMHAIAVYPSRPLANALPAAIDPPSNPPMTRFHFHGN